MCLCTSLFQDSSPRAGNEALHCPVWLMSIISKLWGNKSCIGVCEAAHSTVTRVPSKLNDVPVKKWIYCHGSWKFWSNLNYTEATKSSTTELQETVKILTMISICLLYWVYHSPESFSPFLCFLWELNKTFSTIALIFSPKAMKTQIYFPVLWAPWAQAHSDLTLWDRGAD